MVESIQNHFQKIFMNVPEAEDISYTEEISVQENDLPKLIKNIINPLERRVCDDQKGCR